jgi:hypothetical protein
MKHFRLLPSLLAAVPWAAVVLAAFAVAGLDLASRARAGYQRAERMESQALHPSERDKAVEKMFLDGVAALDRRRLSPAEREIEMEILRKRWEEARLRSPWTDAYHAWRDVYDLTAPPETRWTRRARLLAPAARQRWREDWVARRLPFDDALLDLERGESDGFRLVYSTTDGREASRALNLLGAIDVPCRMLPPAEPAPPGDPSIRFLVPEGRFWDAHQALVPLVGIDDNL